MSVVPSQHTYGAPIDFKAATAAGKASRAAGVPSASDRGLRAPARTPTSVERTKAMASSPSSAPGPAAAAPGGMSLPLKVGLGVAALGILGVVAKKALS